MPRQEQHHLPRNLQVRHVPVEVHPIWALQIQRHLTIEHVVDRHRTLGHRAPPTSMEMPYSTPQPAAPPLRTATTHLDGPRRSLFSSWRLSSSANPTTPLMTIEPTRSDRAPVTGWTG